jgi:hypothetical protein
MTPNPIPEVARLWIELGVNADGVTYSWMLLRDEVRRMEREEWG